MNILSILSFLFAINGFAMESAEELPTIIDDRKSVGYAAELDQKIIETTKKTDKIMEEMHMLQSERQSLKSQLEKSSNTEEKQNIEKLLEEVDDKLSNAGSRFWAAKDSAKLSL